MSKRTSAHSEDGMLKFIELCKQENCLNVLDVGSGQGWHAKVMNSKGLNVSTNDLRQGTTFPGNYNKLDLPVFDGIFCAHTLEHQLNTHDFLCKINKDLKEGGILCITVPPLKHKIVGGHVSLWNAGLILYHLVLAGFNCVDAHIKTYGYNISVVLKKVSIKEKLPLVYDNGDMLTINKYMPKGLKYERSCTFDGDIKEHNW